MKRNKIWVPIGFVVLFFTIFLGSMALWKIGWKHSAAETPIEPTTEVINKSGKDILTIDTTFYNYRYDREIYNNARDQGAQSCYDGSVIPFGKFDSNLSDYYKKHTAKAGIYAGNFFGYYGGLVEDKLEFPGYWYFPWAANIANRTSPYNSVCQGIVSKKLSGFEIGKVNSGTLMTSTYASSSATTPIGEVEMPYFNKDFLAETGSSGVAIGAVRENVGFPFRKITSGSKKGYYEFNSTEDVVRFSGMQGSPSSDEYYFGTKGQLEYYYNTEKVYCSAATDAQFFPFNKANRSGLYYDSNKNSSEQKALDYGFGVRFNIPFRLSEDGKINGKSMVFEFEGDDDVWIFLDGKLVLDLGGQHGKASGTIDFGGSDDTARTTVARVSRIKGSTSAEDTALSSKILAEDTYIQENVSETISVKKGADLDNLHVLTVFYMERGMFESNFHMAFNFVPANEPLPSPTPTMTPNVDAAEGQLTIQNQLVFPTTTPDAGGTSIDKINAAFLQDVKDMAEEDVFSYSVKNQGTLAANVGDSGIKYPSGKLTVRQNPSTTDKLKSYLSFGAQSKVRIYFDIGDRDAPSSDSVLGKIRALGCKQEYDNYNYNFGNFDFQYDSNGNIEKLYGVVNKLTKLQGTTSIYYVDFEATKNSLSFTTDNIPVTGSNQYIKIWAQELRAANGQTFKDFDGKIFTIDTVTYTGGGANISSWKEVTNHKDKTLCIPLGGGEQNYSQTLPYVTIGGSSKFIPDTNVPGFQKVGNTTFALKETYLAPEDADILKNSEITSGITDAEGQFGLFYDDSATFMNQFSKGSRMQVVQNEDLLQPSRYSGTLSTSIKAEDAVTKFTSPLSSRKTEDYYYTTVKVEDTAKTELLVTYDGQFDFANGAELETELVDLTQTFTNTVKTGSLTISKALYGNNDTEDKYTYTFQVSFSNIFGNGSTAVDYSGEYLLITKDNTGNETEKLMTTTDGTIKLHPNEKAKILGIPVGTFYKVKEIVTDTTIVSEISTVYNASIEDEKIVSPTYKESDTTRGITIDKGNRITTGVIPCSIINKSYGSETAEFQEVAVNISYINQFGSLSITKKIAGDVNQALYYKDGKKYGFLVTDEEDNPYSGSYKVHTYTYPNGQNNEPVIETSSSTTTDGKIILEQGQEAEICELSLTDRKQYTIKEILDSTDIFYVEAIKVTEGTEEVDSKSLKNASIQTAPLDATNATFHVVYSNRYSKSFIEIDKYVDALYYGGRKYTDNISYQDLTNAKQSFLFHVKQYKTKEAAEDGGNDYEESFDIVLNIGNETNVISSPKPIWEIEGTEKEFSYKASQKIQVLGNRYYRIEEDTSLSWKYLLKGMNANLSFEQDTDLPDYTADRYGKVKDKVIILKSYLDEKALPIAEFYNVLDSSKNDIDGDVDSAINKIYKNKSDIE